MACRVICRMSSYEELREALVVRRKRLHLSQAEVDEISGLPAGCTARLESGRRIKDLGPLPLLLLLEALDCDLVLTSRKHDENYATRKLETKRKMLADASLGGRISAARLTVYQRRLKARKAAKVRWRNWRIARAEKAKLEAKKGTAKC